MCPFGVFITMAALAWYADFYAGDEVEYLFSDEDSDILISVSLKRSGRFLGLRDTSL